MMMTRRRSWSARTSRATNLQDDVQENQGKLAAAAYGGKISDFQDQGDRVASAPSLPPRSPGCCLPTRARGYVPQSAAIATATCHRRRGLSRRSTSWRCNDQSVGIYPAMRSSPSAWSSKPNKRRPNIGRRAVSDAEQGANTRPCTRCATCSEGEGRAAPAREEAAHLPQPSLNLPTIGRQEQAFQQWLSGEFQQNVAS